MLMIYNQYRQVFVMSRNYAGYSQPLRQLPCAPIRSMPKNQKLIEITSEKRSDVRHIGGF